MTLFIWAEVEGATVIIPASISALKPLFRKVAPFVSSYRTNKSNPGKENRTPAARTPGNWDFEMLPPSNAVYQEKKHLEDVVSHHISWHSEVDEPIVAGPIWDNEERGVLASLEHLPAPEPPPKAPTHLRADSSLERNQRREPRNVV